MFVTRESFCTTHQIAYFKALVLLIHFTNSLFDKKIIPLNVIIYVRLLLCIGGSQNTFKSANCSVFLKPSNWGVTHRGTFTVFWLIPYNTHFGETGKNGRYANRLGVLCHKEIFFQYLLCYVRFCVQLAYLDNYGGEQKRI